MKNFRLQHELQDHRTKNSELDELLAVADQLKKVELPQLSRAARVRIEEQTAKPNKVPRIAAWSLAGGLATVTLVVISAQFAPENSPLYAIKESTDKIQALFQPSQKQQPTIDISNKEELEKIELQPVNDPIAESPKSIKSEQPEKDTSNKKQDNTKRDTRYDSNNRNDSRAERNKSDSDSGFLRQLFRSLTGDW